MHVYAFGSICRGEISRESDIDLLAISDMFDPNLDPELFSIYSSGRIRELWSIGNPFAWHLYHESKIIFSSDDVDFLKSLGSPAQYRNCVSDCKKFLFLFKEAKNSLENKNQSTVFDLSTVFLCVRNIATCFSLEKMTVPIFSRHSALKLDESSLVLDQEAYDIFERARILSTRGKGNALEIDEIQLAVSKLEIINEWMASILSKAQSND